jgi:Subtilase family/Carbohydrate binding domain
MNTVMDRAWVSQMSGHQLSRVLMTALGGIALIACNQPTGDPGSANSKLTVTVRITTNDTSAQIGQKYGGSVLSWHPDSGFAILRLASRPLKLDVNVKSVEASAGVMKSPLLPTGNRGTNPTNAANAWIGGWTSWSGGWTSWSGGWTSWSGGSSIPVLPEQNNVAFSQIRLPQSQAISRNFGAGIKIAVVDTGIDLEHPIFAGHLAPADEWKDFVDGDATPQEEGTTADRGYGHGTGVAGIILQVAPKATILPLRVLEQNGAGDLDNVVAAIDWAIEKGAQVINLSLGAAQNQESLMTEMQYAASKKVYVVASAGNDGVLQGITYPAATAFWDGTRGFVFGIGSVNSGDILSSFSNYGWDLFGLAPGESIFSAFPGNSTASFTGTSFATPIYSGALALGLAELPSGADPTAFSEYLINSVRSGDLSGQNLAARGTGDIGKGRLDVESLIRNLPGWTPKVAYSETNVIQNGSFSDNSLSSWWFSGTPGVLSDEGHLVVQVKPGDAIAQGTWGLLKPNTTYTLSAMIRVPAGADYASFGVDKFGGASSMYVTPLGATYRPHYITFTTGPNSDSADVYISNWSGNSDSMYLYDISLRQTGY